MHFFLDDYRFQTTWSRPRKALQALAPYQMVLSPDFSLYADWPLATQMWNVYRNRWCGRFWQSEGYRVIPTISWSTHHSYDFCFVGVPQNSVVAIGTVGVDMNDPVIYQFFMDGFQEMIRRLSLAVVLCYGPAPAACHELVEIITYPTRWEGIRAARKRAARRLA